MSAGDFEITLAGMLAPIGIDETGTFEITLAGGIGIDETTGALITATFGLASETDTAFAIDVVHLVDMGLATEADTAFSVNIVKIVHVGLASEKDFALPVRILKPERNRWLIRTAHLDQLGEVMVDDMLLMVKRGVGTNAIEPQIWLRVNKDNEGFGQWIKQGLGLAGDNDMQISFGGLGAAHDWQFEFSAPDRSDVQLVSCDVKITRLGA